MTTNNQLPENFDETTTIKKGTAKGDFAAGERTLPPTPKAEDFASGERTQPMSPVEGDFASGEHALPDSKEEGDFATGEHEQPTAPDSARTIPPVPVITKDDE